MFTPISMDEFIRSYKKANPNEDAAALRSALDDAVNNKRHGAKCLCCGQPIWSIGTAVSGWSGCFTCISGEADNSDDYEIDAAIQIGQCDHD